MSQHGTTSAFVAISANPAQHPQQAHLGHGEERARIHVLKDQRPQRLAEGARVGLLHVGRVAVLARLAGSLWHEVGV